MKRKKILPKEHTGRVRHHRHTSYGALSLVLLLTVIPLVVASKSAVIAAGDPVTASNGVYAVVAGAVPTTAPVISSISSGAVINSNDPQTISGSCPNDTLVKIFKNEVFAGSAFCQNGRFSVPVDLFIGSNTLIARAYNATNSQSPDSNPVVVTKQAAGGQSATAVPFSVTGEASYKGSDVNSVISWPITINGGQPPYAVNVAWGDGETELVSRAESGTFTIQHTYSKSGSGYKNSYDITITASDAAGNKSFIHFVGIVGAGQSGIVGSVKQGYQWSGLIRIAWQILLVAVLLVLAFWLGERREVHLMNKKLKTA